MNFLSKSEWKNPYQKSKSGDFAILKLRQTPGCNNWCQGRGAEESARQIISEMRAKIEMETGLTASAGIACNKRLAKVWIEDKIFIDPGIPGPIYGSGCLSLRDVADLTDVTLVDEDTNTILTDKANRTIQCNQAMHVINSLVCKTVSNAISAI